MDKIDKSNELYEKALDLIKSDNDAHVQVLEYLEESLSLGNVNAAYALGTWYLHGENVHKDVQKAIKLLKYSADHHHINALYDLAVCYECGTGVRKNERQAMRLYTEAALRGDAQSMVEVGRGYYYGIGLAKDRPMSKVWYELGEN